MVAFMHTGTRLTAGYRYTTLGDATSDYFGELLFMAHPLPPGGCGNGDPGRYLGELTALEG